jgi:hypothetical protein
MVRGNGHQPACKDERYLEHLVSIDRLPRPTMRGSRTTSLWPQPPATVRPRPLSGRPPVARTGWAGPRALAERSPDGVRHPVPTPAHRLRPNSNTGGEFRVGDWFAFRQPFEAAFVLPNRHQRGRPGYRMAWPRNSPPMSTALSPAAISLNDDYSRHFLGFCATIWWALLTFRPVSIGCAWAEITYFLPFVGRHF